MLFACSNDLEKVREITLSDSEQYPVETVKECEIIYSDSARVRVILNATQMDRYIEEEPYVVFSKGVRVQFLNIDGERESELTADYAIIDEKKHLMEAKRAVKVQNINGDLLETEHLIWNEKLEEVSTNEFVKITTQDEVIYGEGLVANQDFTKYTIEKIKGTIAIKHQ